MISSDGLKVTNNLDLSLFTAAGALFVGTVWAKQILPLSVSATKLSQFLYFPVYLGDTASELVEKTTKIRNIKIFFNSMFYFYTKNHLFQCFELRRWVWIIVMNHINLFHNFV